MELIDAPLSLEEFSGLLEPCKVLRGTNVIAVATSGGADSLALTLLLHEWTQAKQKNLYSLTVDHGLRPGSAQEAGQVHQWLSQRGIAHKILRWDGAKPGTGIQEQARAKRYELLHTWCCRQGVPVLFVGHHAWDQVETFLMRLHKGSGLKGLGAMLPLTYLAGLWVVRPLLALHPQRLKATLQRFQQPFLLDPSNIDSKFERVRWRKTWQQLERAGMSLTGVLSAVKHLQKAQCFIESTLSHLIPVQACPEGYLTLDWTTLKRSSPLTLICLFTELLRVLSPTGFAPKGAAIQRLVEVFLAEAQPVSTLGGVLLQRKKNILGLFRELRSCPPPMNLAPGIHQLWWDYRWSVSLNASQAMVLRALGHDGIRQLKQQPAAPLYSLITLPSLWQDGQLLSIALPGITYASKNLRIEVQQQWRRTPLLNIDPEVSLWI